MYFVHRVARFGRDKYDELAIHNWCSRSLYSIRMKVQNIAAMTDEERYPVSQTVLHLYPEVRRGNPCAELIGTL